MLSVLGSAGFFPVSMVVGYHTIRGTTDFYGYQSGIIGSLTPSSNNFPPSPTQTITQLYYGDTTNTYTLNLSTTAVNSGWTSITINGLTLSRASATFSSSGWVWAAPDSGVALVNSVGNTVKVTFI